MRIEVDYMHALVIHSPRIREKLLVLARQVCAYNGNVMPSLRQMSRQVVGALDRSAELDGRHKAQGEVTDFHPNNFRLALAFQMAVNPPLKHEQRPWPSPIGLTAKKVIPHCRRDLWIDRPRTTRAMA